MPDEKLRQRFEELGREFEAFVARMDTQYGVDLDLEIDLPKLQLVVLSYFQDVSRYKAWHFPDNPAGARLDGTKKAAYMAFWLNKIAPVSARRADSAVPLEIDATGFPVDPLVLATPFFTLHVITNYLGFVLSDKLMSKLLYHMIYREESAKHYLLLFEMLDAVHTDGAGNSIFKRQ